MKEKSKIKNQKSKLRKPTILNFKFLILNSRRDGFTLIEVLVSLSVLIIGLLGVALMQVVSISGNTFSKEMAVATELGQDMLETLRASTYTSTVVDTTLSAGDHTNAELFDASGNAQLNPIDAKGMATDSGGALLPLRLYTRRWTVTDPAAGATFGTGTNMKTIAVTVTWNDRTGTAHSVVLEGVKVRQ